MVLPALRTQFPQSWAVINRFYKLDKLVGDVKGDPRSNLIYFITDYSSAGQPAAGVRPAAAVCGMRLLVTDSSRLCCRCRSMPRSRPSSTRPSWASSILFDLASFAAAEHSQLEVFRVVLAGDANAEKKILGVRLVPRAAAEI